jgi:Cation transporting ATPase, C-terminus
MFGFIITFLGASIFDIAHGEPLLPLQVLWVAFTTVTIQSIGLGYSRPVEGLMERRPRPPSQPILTGGVISWLVSVGLVMAIGTLSVVSWAEQAHTLAIARTMGVVMFSLFNLFFSIESRHRRESVFPPQHVPARRPPLGQLARHVGVGPAELVTLQPLKLRVRDRRHAQMPPDSVAVVPAAVLASGWFPPVSCLPTLAPARRARTSPMASCWLVRSGSGRCAWIW